MAKTKSTTTKSIKLFFFFLSINPMIFSISTLFALHSKILFTAILFNELCVHINRKGKCNIKWMAYKCCWIYDELDNRNVRKMSVACIVVLRKRLNAFCPIAFQTSMKISANNSLEMLVLEAGVWCSAYSAIRSPF